MGGDKGHAVPDDGQTAAEIFRRTAHGLKAGHIDLIGRMDRLHRLIPFWTRDLRANGKNRFGIPADQGPHFSVQQAQIEVRAVQLCRTARLQVFSQRGHAAIPQASQEPADRDLADPGLGGNGGTGLETQRRLVSGEPLCNHRLRFCQGSFGCLQTQQKR